MARVKNSVATRARRKKVIKLAKGYYGRKSTVFKTANQAVVRSATYAYRDRKAKKRDFRKLWITRISAQVKAVDASFNYSRFMNGLKKAGVTLNRKMLAEIAVADKEGFAKLVEQAKAAL